MRACRRQLLAARVVLAAAMLALAGCVQLPLTPLDLQARKFESIPDKVVIYVVRDSPDFSDVAATIWLGEKLMLTTYPGTYFRWEVPPGAHRITGAAADIGQITLDTRPGTLYFVQQRVAAAMMGFPQSSFHHVDAPNGRAAVLRSVLLKSP